jgi:DNA-binding NarL/FixJ family response regulator
MKAPIRILVADDHPVVRDGLVAMLGTQPDFMIVGQASNGAEVVDQVAALKPDAVLLDLEMPEMDGVEALERIAAYPDTKVVVFTVFDTDERILAALRAGAKGYLLKGAPRAEVFNAIRVVSQVGSLLQSAIASKILQQLNKSGESNAEKLTDRENEVLGLLAQGKSNQDIAAMLTITERTVKFHVSSIMSKLSAHNRTEVVSIAVQRGLTKID